MWVGSREVRKGRGEVGKGNNKEGRKGGKMERKETMERWKGKKGREERRTMVVNK